MRDTELTRCWAVVSQCKDHYGTHLHELHSTEQAARERLNDADYTSHPKLTFDVESWVIQAPGVEL